MKQKSQNKTLVGLKIMAPIILTALSCWKLYEIAIGIVNTLLGMFGIHTHKAWYIYVLAGIIIWLFLTFIGFIATSRKGKKLNKYVDTFFLSIVGVNIFYGFFNQFFSFDEKEKGWIPISLAYYKDQAVTKAYVTSLRKYWDIIDPTVGMVQCYSVNITISGGAFGGHTVSMAVDVIQPILDAQARSPIKTMDMGEAYTWNLTFGSKIPERLLVQPEEEHIKVKPLLSIETETTT